MLHRQMQKSTYRTGHRLMTSTTPPERGVLVIDDDVDIRSVMCELLTDEGYQVKTAMNGRDALATLASWRPDVILLDLMMPIMDGWTFLTTRLADRRLRRIPVIVMSASHTLSRGDERLAVADMVAKPFEIDAVLTKVAALAHNADARPQPLAS
jgi:CheY-like chemotaxis protein